MTEIEKNIINIVEIFKNKILKKKDVVDIDCRIGDIRKVKNRYILDIMIPAKYFHSEEISAGMDEWWDTLNIVTKVVNNTYPEIYLHLNPVLD